MTSAASTRIFVREKGESIVDLTLTQAMELQDLRFCRVTPTRVAGRWRITDVNKVGVAAVSGSEIHISPKTPLENIVFMASMGKLQLRLEEPDTGYDAASSIPTAIARAFLATLETATRRGLLKGYRNAHDSASVVRGRWNIPRQLARRPGIPLPVEIDFDDFTEDIDENRILRSALGVLGRLGDVSASLGHSLTTMQVLFSEVDVLPRGLPLPEVRVHRLNQHYATSLRLARVILDSVSWTHREGATVGGTFLVDMAAVFEAYIANRVRSNLSHVGLDVTAQDRRWWLDSDHSVALRPDIVISRDGAPVTVADTKYKVLGDGNQGVPNGDVYQAVAYALALGVSTAHLIYVSEDAVAREIVIPTADVRVRVHAMPLDGSLEDLENGVATLTGQLGLTSSEG